MPYDNIRGFQFVGDLSMEDADVLAGLGKSAKRILEFGVGGSTQIFSQCRPEILTCVETDPKWVEITQNRLALLPERTEPKFVPYDLYTEAPYDLIFVDGAPHLRREFAINTWGWLQVGGVMVFHDTRRYADFQHAAWIAQLYYSEISRIDVNVENSNLTVIHKREKLPYVNWNHTEGKPAWAYGNAEIPEGEGLWKANA